MAEKRCDVDDIMCQFQTLNFLEGMEKLLGTERFQASYPEFTGLEKVVKERMDEQRTSIQATMKRCGMDTKEFEEEEGIEPVAPEEPEEEE